MYRYPQLYQYELYCDHAFTFNKQKTLRLTVQDIRLKVHSHIVAYKALHRNANPLLGIVANTARTQKQVNTK